MGGAPYSVAVITHALYSGVEGELPFEYWDKLRVEFVDLKGPSDRFATIDYSDTAPVLYTGEYVTFESLHLKNLRDAAADDGPQVTGVKGLNCPQCGAAIELRSGQLAQTVVCPSCTAILDARDPNLAVLQKAQDRLNRATPAIPLGTTGTLGNERWQVIGFQLRGVVVSGVTYSWREYLLWNAEHGFRYLTEYDGHWNDVVVVKGTPKETMIAGTPQAEYNGTTFKHFQSANAETFFVLGEFPWEVRTGDKVDDADFVAPPYMLSSERTADEVTWSLGTYTAPERIAEAFKLPSPLPAPRGIFANQPNPRSGAAGAMKGTFFLLAAALLVLAVTRFVTARNQSVFTQSYEYATNGDSAAYVTPVFTLDGHTSNVELDIRTSLSNAWALLQPGAARRERRPRIRVRARGVVLRRRRGRRGVARRLARGQGRPAFSSAGALLPSRRAGPGRRRAAVFVHAGGEARRAARLALSGRARVARAAGAARGLQRGELRVQPVARERPPLGNHVVRFERRRQRVTK